MVRAEGGRFESQMFELTAVKFLHVVMNCARYWINSAGAPHFDGREKGYYAGER
jgi:hypothetical protein